MIRVTVAIVAYESGEFLQPCVDALAAQSFADFDCVVADNGSSDGSTARLRLPDARFVLREMGGNVGFAAANNRVAQASGAEFLACLNPDARPDGDWLLRLVEAADAHPDCASFGSVQLRLEEPHRLDGLGDCWHLAGIAWRAGEGELADDLPPDGEIMGPCGAAALYRREPFLRLGGFEERFFCYCEDVDLALRLQRAGWRSWRASRSVIRHAGSAISGRRSDFTLYHGHRNRVWCWVKNTPGAAFWALLPLHLALNLYVAYALHRQGHGAPVRRAYRDALRGIGPFLRARREADAGGFAAVRRVSALRPGAPWRRLMVPEPSGWTDPRRPARWPRRKPRTPEVV